MARRQDTFDLRSQLQYDDDTHLGQNTVSYSSDDDPDYSDHAMELDADPDQLLDADADQGQQHSMIEDDSDSEDRYDDDDRSSSLSIPNESIDFDLVYSLHSFAATVEGQASVVKGDSLVLMDDTNSYWWLVRVLKTQEIGYIPAENIETPFERLARLNKHRNVDVRILLPHYILFLSLIIVLVCSWPARLKPKCNPVSKTHATASSPPAQPRPPNSPPPPPPASTPTTTTKRTTTTAAQ